MRVLVVHNSGHSQLSSGELSVVENEVNTMKQNGVECNLQD